MTSDLLSLRDIIVSAIDSIVDVCTQSGREFPSLDDPVHPSEFTPDGIRNDPQVLHSITLAVAASTQLIATLQAPATSLTVAALMFNLPAALGVVEAWNVAEIIRPAGAKGMHAEDICNINGADPKKLSHVLRFLATQHWFREVAPDTFAHNMLSSLIDTGKNITEDFASTKHQGTTGLAALVGCWSDEGVKMASYFTENLTDPKTSHSQEANEAALQRGLGISKTMWEYYDSPEGRMRGDRFDVFMTGYNTLQPPMDILQTFDWNTIPDGHLLVDVGGGLGHVALEVTKVHPSIHVVIEDRENVLKKAKLFWEENSPSHVSEEKVHFITTDFFDEQPILPGEPGVFLLRNITHNWSDKYAIRILRRLRDAAIPSTKLVLISCITDYACRLLNDEAEAEAPPVPLLANLGGANIFPYSFDLAMLGLFNAKERTQQDHVDILGAAGWTLSDVRRNSSRREFLSSIIAIPAES